MTKKQALGQIRELLMWVGTAMVSFGIITDTFDFVPIVGALCAVISLAWAINERVSWGILSTLIKKALSAISAALTTYGVMSDQQAAAMAGIVGQALPLFLSYMTNAPETPVPPGPAAWRTIVLLFLLAPFCSINVSCTVTIDPVTNQPVLHADPVVIASISRQVVEEFNNSNRGSK